jgi:hypothetical protein
MMLSFNSSPIFGSASVTGRWKSRNGNSPRLMVTVAGAGKPSQRFLRRIETPRDDRDGQQILIPVAEDQAERDIVGRRLSAHPVRHRQRGDDGQLDIVEG